MDNKAAKSESPAHSIMTFVVSKNTFEAASLQPNEERSGK
jgi:hypothetical protein